MKYEEYSNDVKVPMLLEKIYKKLAGDSAEDIENIDSYSNDTKVPMLLEKIYDVIDTASDSGSDSSDSSGNSNTEIVTLTETEDEGTGELSYSASATFDEITTMISEGKAVFLLYKKGVYPIQIVEESYYLFGNSIVVDGPLNNSLLATTMLVSSDNTWELLIEESFVLPDPNNSASGNSDPSIY